MHYLRCSLSHRYLAPGLRGPTTPACYFALESERLHLLKSGDVPRRLNT